MADLDEQTAVVSAAEIAAARPRREIRLGTGGGDEKGGAKGTKESSLSIPFFTWSRRSGTQVARDERRRARVVALPRSFAFPSPPHFTLR